MSGTIKTTVNAAYKYCFYFLTILVLSSCSTLPGTFTTEKVMKIHQGMSSDEIITMFGTPRNVSQSVCGSNTGHSWTCTTWEYGQFPYDRASFTFSGDSPNQLKLNNFDIDR